MKVEKLYMKWFPVIVVLLMLVGIPFILSNIYAAWEVGSESPYPATMPSAATTGLDVDPSTIATAHSHDRQSRILNAIAAKVGTGASTPTDDTVLTGTGTGGTAYGKVEDEMLANEDFGDFKCDGTEDGCTVEDVNCSGCVHTGDIDSGVTADAEWDTIEEIETATSEDIIIEGEAIGDTTPATGTFTALICDSVTANPNTNPQITLTDADGADTNEPHAKILGNLTSTPSTDEDMNLNVQVKIAGTLTTVIDIDADDDITIGSSGMHLLATVKTVAYSTTQTLSVAECKGGVIYAGGATSYTITLPPVFEGAYVTIMDTADAGTIVIAADGADEIEIDSGGSTGTSGELEGAKGNLVTFIYGAANDWYVIGHKGFFVTF